MAPEPKFWDEDTHAPTFGQAIADPTGGTTVDAEGRATIAAILTVLRAAGLIEQD